MASYISKIKEETWLALVCPELYRHLVLSHNSLEAGMLTILTWPSTGQLRVRDDTFIQVSRTCIQFTTTDWKTKGFPAWLRDWWDLQGENRIPRISHTLEVAPKSSSQGTSSLLCPRLRWQAGHLYSATPIMTTIYHILVSPSGKLPNTITISNKKHNNALRRTSTTLMQC